MYVCININLQERFMTFMCHAIETQLMETNLLFLGVYVIETSYRKIPLL